MQKQILNWIITKQENFLGTPLEYLRDVAKLSTPAFLKMSLITPLARHRRRLPRTSYHLATLVVTKHEDCGTCVQIAVNLAKREGVPIHYIHAALEGRFSDLPNMLAEICEFSSNVAQGWESEELRERLRQFYGDEAMMELALAISTARVYPTLKRATGYAQRCEVAPLKV